MTQDVIKWSNNQHVFTAALFDDEIEWDIEHPSSCPLVDHRHYGGYYDCPIGRIINDVGVFEALAGDSERFAVDQPTNWLGPVIAKASLYLLIRDTVRIPFSARFCSWYDNYFGEYDYELELAVDI